jgi:hypothetical protein
MKGSTWPDGGCKKFHESLVLAHNDAGLDADQYLGMLVWGYVCLAFPPERMGNKY